LLVAKKKTFDDPDKANGDFVYHPIPGGDLAFSYLLEVEVKPDISLNSLYEVNLTFKWPVLDDPTQKESSKTADDVNDGKFISKMKFPSLGIVKKAIWKDKLIIMQPTLVRQEAARAILGVIGAEASADGWTIDYLLTQAPPTVEFGDIEAVLEDLTLVVPDFKKVMQKFKDPITRVESWRLIQRPYEGQGLYSMRLLGQPGSVLNGGYVPKGWGDLGRFFMLLDPFINQRFLGFKSAGGPAPADAKYFDQLYFLTPNNQ